MEHVQSSRGSSILLHTMWMGNGRHADELIHVEQQGDDVAAVAVAETITAVAANNDDVTAGNVDGSD